MLQIKKLYIDYQPVTENMRSALCATGKPVFTWMVEGCMEGDQQQEFSVDFYFQNKQKPFYSKRVKSAECFYEYDGPELAQGRVMYVVVSVYSKLGAKKPDYTMYNPFAVAAVSNWDAAWLETAIDMPLRRPRYFRKTFKLHKKVEAATLYACGIGYHKVFVNGLELDDKSLLDPATTDYSKQCQYVTYTNAGDFLVDGENCIGIEVAIGWRYNFTLSKKRSDDFFDWVDESLNMDKMAERYDESETWKTIPFCGKPTVTAMLHVFYANGSDEWIKTDETWECGTGAFVYADVFNGTIYDARLRNPLWSTAEFEGFAQAALAKAPGGRMEPMTLMPVEIYSEISPVSKWYKDGTWVFDFGVNMAGLVRLSLPAGLKKGQKITVSHAEEISADGRLFKDTLRSAEQNDVYIANGDEEEGEEFVPRFTYHGFRYVSIEGMNGIPFFTDPVAVAFCNNLIKDSHFRCGNPIVSTIYKMAVQTELSNIHHLLTDCPQRDERLGWMNDATVRFQAFPYQFESNQMFRKIIRDIMDSQGKEGGITCTAPFVWGQRPGDPVCSSFLIGAYENFLFYNDKTMIAEGYKAFQAWEKCLLAKSDDDGIVQYSLYGDWAAPAYACGYPEDAESGVTPGIFISTGYSYFNCGMLVKFAQIMGKKADEKKYKALQEKIRDGIMKKWYHAEEKRFATGSQACQVFSMWLGLFPEEDIPVAIAKVAEELRLSGYQFTTGNLCTRYLFEMLTKYGYVDDAWTLITKDTYPSFGYMIQQEATTIWERFEQKKNAGMNSHCHPMYGSIYYWFYAYLAGVRPAEPGCSRMIVKPYFPSKLQSLQAQVETCRGPLSVRWFRRYDELVLQVSVPTGMTAVVDFNGKEQECGFGFHSFSMPCREA